MRQLLMIILLLLTITFSTTAQSEAGDFTLKGSVIDGKTEQPLMFAALAIKGHARGTSTDEFGKFELKILEKYKNDTLLFSMLSYENTEIAIASIWGNTEQMNIILLPTSFELPIAEVGATIILRNIEFEFGKHVILESSYPELEKIYNYMERNPDIEIEVSGHTDSIGTDEYNSALSAVRAGAVVAWLEERGVEQSRMSSVGLGESRHISPNHTEEGRQQNRRVEFKIMKIGDETVGEEIVTTSQPIPPKPTSTGDTAQDETVLPGSIFPKQDDEGQEGVIEITTNTSTETTTAVTEPLEEGNEIKGGDSLEEVFVRKKGTVSDFVDSIVQIYVAEEAFNGAIMIGDKNKVLYEKVSGDANKAWDVPITAATKFRLGAISEQFTAYLVFQLIEEGKLDITKPINSYLKEYNLKDGNDLTVEHLLSHASGYTNDLKVTSQEEQGSWNHKEMVNAINQMQLVATPGKVYLYSRVNYYLLALIVEQVTDEDFTVLLQEDVLNPMKLNQVEIFEPQKVDKNGISSYQKVDAEYLNITEYDLTWGADNLVSTIGDLYQWNKTFQENAMVKKYLSLLTKTELSKVENGNFNFDGRIGISFKEGNGSFSNGEGYQGVMTNLNGYTVLIMSNVENNGLEKVLKDIFKILY